MATQIHGRINCVEWQETSVGRAETLPRVAQARVVNTFSGGVEAARSSCAYTIVYATEKTGTFTGAEVLSGEVDGRAGEFVLAERGTFEPDGTVRGSFEIVEAASTGELAGLRGHGEFTFHPGETSFPYSLTYEWPEPN